MNIIHASSSEEMSQKAATILAGQILAKPDCILGLATGGTPVGTYARLVELYKGGILDFSRVRTFNLDEYCGLQADDPNSYHHYMREQLFDHVNLPPESTALPDGMAPDLPQACAEYERLIRQAGGIDLQLLGLGHNGHIGFNEPGDHFALNTHVVRLTESTIDANTRFYPSREEVPVWAVTMGIGTIMRAKKILLVVSGNDKKEILQRALEGPVTPRVPASILQLHPDCTVVAAV